MGGKLGMGAVSCRLVPFVLRPGWREVNLGDLFSEGVKEQRSPFLGWAIRHARNFNSRNAEQYLSLNNRGPRYSASIRGIRN